MAHRAPRANHPTTKWAQDVVDGRIVAGPWVRLACLRHLNDLKDGHKRGLYFDQEEADANFAFHEECLIHPSGRLEGQPFRLLPHQKFKNGSLFGWYGPEGRRFRISYCEEAKGSGKTPGGAGNALYVLTVDGGNATQIYCAAFSGRQAIDIAWTECYNYARSSPWLDRQLEYNKHTHRIISGNSFIGVLSSEDRGASGQRVNYAFVDELHEHRGPEVLQKIQKGTKSEAHPLIFIVTNSGVDRLSICYHYHEWAKRVLAASVPGGDPAGADDQLFAFVCGMDPADYEERKEGSAEESKQVQISLAKVAERPELWVKSNPGIEPLPSQAKKNGGGPEWILSRTYLENEVRQALNMPAAQNITLRLNFCIWTDAVSVWIPDNVIMARAVQRDLEAELKGQVCYAGLDLARARDLSALVLLFPPAGSRETWAFFERYYCPELDIRERSERDRVPYQQWQRSGHLIATPGNVTDFRWIRADILKLADEYTVKEWAYDRTFATELVTDLGEDGLVMVPVGQGAMTMNAPVREIERLICAESPDGEYMIEHMGHPITRWCFSNVALAEDRHGGVSLDKERSKEKIDGVQALANAASRAILAPTPERGCECPEPNPDPAGLCLTCLKWTAQHQVATFF